MNKAPVLKACIIGIGKQSIEDHIPGIKHSKNAKLVSILDKDKKVSSKWGKNLNISNYTSLSKLIKETSPDFAIVAVPHDQYLKIIKKLAKNKIHILKEKPLAINFKEAKLIKKITSEAGIELMITLQRRFNPIYSSFIQLMKQIGKPFFIKGQYTLCIDSPENGWRGDKKRAGGGCIIDMGYHLIDLLIWYFGLPDLIHAEYKCLAKPDSFYDAEDTATITFRYSEQGIIGTLMLSRSTPPKSEFFKLIGSKGTVNISRGNIIRTDKFGKILEDLSRKKNWTAAATTQIDYFCDIITKNKKNIGSPIYHLQHMAFIEASYLSQKLGQYVNPYQILNNHE